MCPARGNPTCRRSAPPSGCVSPVQGNPACRFSAHLSISGIITFTWSLASHSSPVSSASLAIWLSFALPHAPHPLPQTSTRQVCPKRSRPAFLHNRPRPPCRTEGVPKPRRLCCLGTEAEVRRAACHSSTSSGRGAQDATEVSSVTGLQAASHEGSVHHSTPLLLSMYL